MKVFFNLSTSTIPCLHPHGTRSRCAFPPRWREPGLRTTAPSRASRRQPAERSVAQLPNPRCMLGDVVPSPLSSFAVGRRRTTTPSKPPLLYRRPVALSPSATTIPRALRGAAERTGKENPGREGAGRRGAAARSAAS